MISEESHKNPEGFWETRNHRPDAPHLRWELRAIRWGFLGLFPSGCTGTEQQQGTWNKFPLMKSVASEAFNWAFTNRAYELCGRTDSDLACGWFRKFLWNQPLGAWLGKKDKLRTSLRNSGNPGVDLGWSRGRKTGTHSALAVQNSLAPAHAPTERCCGFRVYCLMTAGFQLSEECPGQCLLAFSSWELSIDHKFMSSSFLRSRIQDFSPQFWTRYAFHFSHHLPGKLVICVHCL